MMPPWPSRVSTKEVQWGAELDCLKDARDVPVCISWRTIAPEPDAEGWGAVAHRMTSCRSILEMHQNCFSPVEFGNFAGRRSTRCVRCRYIISRSFVVGEINERQKDLESARAAPKAIL